MDRLRAELQQVRDRLAVLEKEVNNSAAPRPDEPGDKHV
jgi:hypothetical protein